jgi:ribonuclease T2
MSMKAFAGFALLALIAAAPALAVNWNHGDPVAQVRAELDSAPAPAAAPVSALGGSAAGQFDSYVFSLEWEPAFCEGKSSLPECAALSAGSFGAANLSLHGLWPDQSSDSSHRYGYCGVDSRTRQLDRGSTWCDMPALGLSPSTLDALTPAMPGVASCLENHEWYKHGSCSGYSPDEYFTRAAGLVDAVAASSFGRWVNAHAGQTVSDADFRSAFESYFGAGSSSYVSLLCTNAGGADMLLDVRMHLAVPLQAASDLPQMLLPDPGEDKCPSSFLLDPSR